jgi:hypothetical protein
MEHALSAQLVHTVRVVRMQVSVQLVTTANVEILSQIHSTLSVRVESIVHTEQHSNSHVPQTQCSVNWVTSRDLTAKAVSQDIFAIL